MDNEDQPAEGDKNYRTWFEQIIELIEQGKYEEAAKKSIQASLHYAEVGPRENAEILAQIGTAIATLMQAKARANSWSVKPSAPTTTSGGYTPKDHHYRNDKFKDGYGWNGE